MTAPGVTVREQPTAGASPIQPATSSIPGFLFVCERGPTNRAVSISSEAQFRRVFGGPISTSYAAEAIRGFFACAGDGARCWVARVISLEGNTAATFDLQTAASGATKGSLSSNAGVFPVALAAGDTFTGKVDGAGAVTGTIQATPATRTLTGGTYAAGAGGDSITFTITVMGLSTTQVVDLSAVAGTQTAYVNAFNAQLVGARAEASGLDIVLTTDQKGSGAAASITAIGGAAAAKTGATVAAFANAGPNNVANVLQTTGLELATLFENTFAGTTTTANSNGSVTWETDTPGAGGSVQLTAGTGVAKIAGFDLVVHSGAASGAAVDSVQVDASSVGFWGNRLSVKVSSQDTRVGALGATLTTGDTSFTAESLAVARKLKKGDTVLVTNALGTVKARGTVSAVNGMKVSIENLGGFSFAGGPIAASGSIIYNETFSLSVFEDAALVYGPIRDLRMSPNSSRYFKSYFNGDGTNAEVPVVLDDYSPTSDSTHDPRPVNTSANAWGDVLTGATESTAYGDNNFETALALFDKVTDIRLLAAPGETGISTPGAISKMLADYASASELMSAVIEIPSDTTVPSSAVTHRQTKVGDTSYGAAYFPWLLVTPFDGGAPMACPPAGHVCGAIVRTHRNRGVAKAAAGITDGRLNGVVGLVGLKPGEDWSEGDADLLNEGNINLIRWKNGNATIMGGRTMQAGEFLFFNKRLANNYFKASFLAGTEFAIFESPGTEETTGKVRRTLEAFLLSHYPRDLDGATPKDAFTIVCDSRNNTAETKNAGLTLATVSLALKGTTERLIIDVTQKSSVEV